MRRLAMIIAIIGLCAAIWGLERARQGVAIDTASVQGTPVSIYRQTKEAPPAPAVVIAHGFAGSRQLMEAWALTLAQAGYIAVSFDFEGHGKNPQPLRGDVTAVEGTTRYLVDETLRVAAYARALPGADGRVALLGHSMATDVIARAAAEAQIDTVVGISMYSQAVGPDTPKRLLLISGQAEPQLRAFATRAVESAAPGIDRRAMVAPRTDHVSVLWSRPGLAAARDWIDAGFGRNSAETAVAATGPWVALGLFSLVLLAWPAARLLPSGTAPSGVPTRVFWAASLSAALLPPLALAPFDIGFLPVLVADYLAVHAALYGAIVLAVLRAGGVRIGGVALWPLLALCFWGILCAGGFFERYVASFMPSAARLPILGAMALGCSLAMVSEAALTQAGRASFWRKAAARLSFLGSLAIAVALDFEGLMFLVLILPLIVLFYASFGLVGGWIGRRSGAVLATGAGLGLCLGWALAVTFPMFAG